MRGRGQLGRAFFHPALKGLIQACSVQGASDLGADREEQVFDLFWDVFQDNRVTVQEVRLLTAREQTEAQDGKKPPLNLDRYHKLRAELLTRGIHTELRLLEKNQLPHDRLLYTPGQAINMPPFGGAYGEHRHVSEYTQSKTKRELFTQYWEKALVPSVNEQSDSKGM